MSEHCRGGTVDGRMCREFRGLYQCEACPASYCYRHLCDHLLPTYKRWRAYEEAVRAK